MKKGIILAIATIVSVSFRMLAVSDDPNVSTDEPDMPAVVTPPDGLPSEDWVMTFLNYQEAYGYYDYNKDDYPGPRAEEWASKRDITVKWDADADAVYMKGIFAPYPEAWIKGDIVGDDIFFGWPQLIYYTVPEPTEPDPSEPDAQDSEPSESDPSAPEPVYFFSGAVEYYFGAGNTYSYHSHTFRQSVKCTYTLSSDGRDIKLTNLSSGGDSDSAFWFSGSETCNISFETFNSYDDPDGSSSNYRNIDYIACMRFRKKADSGVGDIVSESEAEKEIYDLQGHKVDTGNLLPGIYISRCGDKTEKILIR